MRQSIASLQHQINLEKKSLKDRRKRIHDERKRQQQLIINTKTLISVGRKYRETVQSSCENVKMPRELPKRFSPLSTTANATAPDLIRLREKLIHVRCRLAEEKI